MFFIKKVRNMFGDSKKSPTFASQLRNKASQLKTKRCTLSSVGRATDS